MGLQRVGLDWVTFLSGEGNGNPLQYSCLENSTDRGAWQAALHGSQRVRHDWVTTFSYVHNFIASSFSFKTKKRKPWNQVISWYASFHRPLKFFSTTVFHSKKSSALVQKVPNVRCVCTLSSEFCPFCPFPLSVGWLGSAWCFAE